MEELAVFEMPEEVMPTDLDELRVKLEGAGLEGRFSVKDDMLVVDWEGDQLVFELYAAVEEGGLSGGPGVEVMGTVEDAAATLLDLSAIFDKAFPGCQGSTEWGEI